MLNYALNMLMYTAHWFTCKISRSLNTVCDFEKVTHHMAEFYVLVSIFIFLFFLIMNWVKA